MSTPMSDMSGDSTLGTLSLRDKALIKRNISRHHNSNFKAGYVPVHEPSLGRTGVRGRKTFLLWALVLLLFALAAANLCLTLTVLGVLRVGHGMEAIEFLSELGLLKFRGIADLDRVTKRDGRIQGFAGSPVEISGDGGSVLFDLGTSVGPRISLDEDGISMTRLESLDVLLHGAARGGASGVPLTSLHGPPPVFSTRFPNFGLPRGVRRLDVASATAKRLSAPVGSSLRLKSASRVRLRGSEGAILDGKELAWSADQDVLLRSVNGSILLNGTKGVTLDVRSVPLVPLPTPNHVAALRRMRAVSNGERVNVADNVGGEEEYANLKEHKQRRAENLHRRNYFQAQAAWVESGRGTKLTQLRRIKTRRLHRTVKQMAEDLKNMPFGSLKITKSHSSAAFSAGENLGQFGEKHNLYGIPWETENDANSSHVHGIPALRSRRGGKVGPRPQFKTTRQCSYQLASHHKMDSKPLQSASNLRNGNTKTTNFPPCHTPTPRNTRSWCQQVNVSNPYDMLHCSCHECKRAKMYVDQQMDRCPLGNISENEELARICQMMDEKYDDHFCSTYQTTYSKESCLLHKPPGRLPLKEEDMCYPIECLERLSFPKKRDPSTCRITPKGGINPTILRTLADESIGTTKESTQRLWNSEYMDGISYTGEKIIKEKLHVTKPKHFQKN